jgi:hypothetical protein
VKWYHRRATKAKKIGCKRGQSDVAHRQKPVRHKWLQRKERAEKRLALQLRLYCNFEKPLRSRSDQRSVFERKTRKELGWQPKQPGLIPGLDRPRYFEARGATRSSAT